MEEFVIYAGGELYGVGHLVGVDGAAVALVAAVLHVHQADVLAVEELGVTAAVAVDGDCLFKEVLSVVIDGEGASVALARADALLAKHDGLQIDAFANFHCLWFHNLMNF